MVKRILRSSWLRSCFVVMSCALVLVASVAPAFAFAIDNTDTEKSATILSGNVTYTFSPSVDDVASTVDVTHSFGGMLPMPDGSGDYYGQDYTDFLLSVTDDPQWNISTEYRLSRALRVIDNHSMACYLYTVSSYENSDDGSVRLPYTFIEYNFNSYMFEENYNATLFKWFLRLKLNRPCEVTTRVVYTLAFDGVVGFYSEVVEDSYTSEATPSVPEYYHPLEKASNRINEKVGSGGSVLIQEISVSVRPTSVSYILSTGFELLGSNWINAVPHYVPLNSQGVYDPVGVSFSGFMKYLGETYDGISPTPTPPDLPDVEIGSRFTSFLASSVSGFFDFELMPGFSLGGVMAAIIAVVIVLLLLKFFSGG